MRKFILVHQHSYGEDAIYFQSNSTVEGLLTNINSVFETLSISYEEEKGDTYSLVQIPSELELKTVIL